MEGLELDTTLEPKQNYLLKKKTLEPKGCCSLIVIQNSYKPITFYIHFLTFFMVPFCVILRIWNTTDLWAWKCLSFMGKGSFSTHVHNSNCCSRLLTNETSSKDSFTPVPTQVWLLSCNYYNSNITDRLVVEMLIQNFW